MGLHLYGAWVLLNANLHCYSANDVCLLARVTNRLSLHVPLKPSRYGACRQALTVLQHLHHGGTEPAISTAQYSVRVCARF